MGLFQTRVDSLLRKSEMDAMIRLGIRKLNEEGYTRERLNTIIAKEKEYQKMYRSRHNNATIPAASDACIIACEKLLFEIDSRKTA